ncbi:hypothetical protein LP419_17420 [Massilia sp. H-1]|nr:hypothetical protein LP419_17420 [Massilia sp. H-1]
MEDGAAEVMRDVMRNASNNADMTRAMRVFEKAGRADLAGMRWPRKAKQAVLELVAMLAASKAKEGDYRGAVALMMEAVDKLPDNPQVAFNAAVAALKCLENLGWDERLGQSVVSLITTVRFTRSAQSQAADIGQLAPEHTQAIRQGCARQEAGACRMTGD